MRKTQIIEETSDAADIRERLPALASNMRVGVGALHEQAQAEEAWDADTLRELQSAHDTMVELTRVFASLPPWPKG